MDYLGGFLPKRKFPTPAPPTAISFQSLTANGTSGTVSTTQLTATFDVDPGLTTANFVVTGASKGTVTNVDGDYYINVFDIPEDGQIVTLDVINVPSSVTITPLTRTVTVYKAAELEAPTFEFDLIFPSIAAGASGSFDASYCFSGEVDSYSIATGTLPVWLTFDTETSIFTYTDAEESTVSGVSITATNTAGSATTNEADFAVVESVEGQGTISSMPSPYYGSMYTDATGIVVDGIEMLFTDTHAPCHIKAHLNLRLAGARRFSGLPLRETLCHIVWTLTYADDSALPYHGEVIEEYTQIVINPYTDTYGPVFGIDLFDHGDFKLTGRAYVATSDGMTLFDEATTTFSRAEFGGQYIYYDKVNGLNTNGGEDPLGVGLADAGYVEATGIISEAGKFAGVVLDDDTNTYRINTNRWLSTSLGRVYLDEIIDDNSARIADEYKFGADATGITSSNGPKQFFTGLNPTPTTANRFFLLSGNNADTVHELTQPVNTRGKDGHLALIGYSGTPILRPAADTSGFTGGDGLITFRQSPSTTNAPDNFVMNNITLDGDLRVNPVGGAFDNGDNDLTQVITRQVQVIKSGGGTAFSIQKGSNKPIHWVDRGSYFENIRYFTYETTVAVDAFNGDSSIVVTGEIPTTIPTSAAFRFDGDDFAYHYSSKTFDGTNTTITIPAQRDPGDGKLEKNYPAGTVIKLSKQIKEPIFVAITSYTLQGPRFKGVADKPKYQHYMYPSVYGGNNLAAWGSGIATDNGLIGFMYNFNNDSGETLHRHSFIGNYVTGCTHFLDCGNATNNPLLEVCTGFYVVSNAGNPRNASVYMSTGVDWFLALNDFWSLTPYGNNVMQGGENAGLLQFDPPSSAVIPDIQNLYDWDWTLERNRGKNYKLWADNNLPRISKAEFLYNEVELDHTTSSIIDVTTSGVKNLVVKGNNMTMPNSIASTFFRIDNFGRNLADFNAAIGDVNTSDAQDWPDFPPNDDLELILGGGTKYAAITGFNQSSVNDKVGTGDDFDFSYTFKFLDAPNFTPLFAPGSGSNVLRLTNTTTIRWAGGGGNFDFTVPAMVIGQEYTHIWRRRSGVLSLEHNGVVNATTASTTAFLTWSRIAAGTSTPATQRLVIKNISLTRLLTPWTIGYNVDGGEVPESPSTSIAVPADISTGTMDSHSITYYGIDEDDWV